MKALLFGLGVFLGYTLMAGMPARLPDTTAEATGGLVALLLVVAYLGGRWHGRGLSRATAVATATARASASTGDHSQTVQVYVGDRDDDPAATRPRRVSAAGRVLPSGAVLLGTHHPARAVEEGQLVDTLDESGALQDLVDD